MSEVLSDQDRPIGVFDSGLGGVSTLRSLCRVLPREDFIYLGDTANAPYGTKTPEQVLACVDGVMERLLSYDVKAVVIACNTATSVAAPSLRERLTLPVIGMEPALKPAHELRRKGSVLVLATPVTLRLPKFAALYEKYGEGAVPLPCPGLMDLVEREDFTAAEDYLRKKLSAFDPASIDAVVLGCTHYVFLRPILTRLLPPTAAILDGNEGTARQLHRVLEGRQLLSAREKGSVTFLTTGQSGREIPAMKRLFSLPEG